MILLKKFFIIILASGFKVCLADPLAAMHYSQVEVMPELERLMSMYKFEVRGLEQTAAARVSVGENTVLSRVHNLLEDFDHIIVQTPQGGIERVIILGAKKSHISPGSDNQDEDDSNDSEEENDAAGDIILPTQRNGASHTVTLKLEGAKNHTVMQRMLIDTGADQVVLPGSLLGTLGLATATMREQKVQTANGPVAARIGRLPGLWLSNTRLANIDVAFIEDTKLGGQALLGMNVLQRFRLTIDDANNRIILARKAGSPTTQ